jgi:gliding motility-associated-like protein
VFQVNVLADSYRWQDGSTQRTFTAATSGLVRATATQAGCSWTDSLRIEIFDPPKPNLGLDTTLCEGVLLTLQADGPAQAYQWQDGSTGSSFDVEFPGVYVLSAFEGPCVARDTIVVDFRRCTVFNAFLPNAFSPNGDGINDAFRPFLPPDVTIIDYTFRVFDRWGNLVFETDQIDREWDGTFRGNLLPQGVFLYFIHVRYQDDFGEDVAQLSGDVLLTR